MKTYGPDKVGVLLISFQEDATLFFSEAKKQDVLWTVKWYGSDGTCLSAALLDPAVADFCAATRFINTYFSPTKSDKHWKVHDKLVDVLEREPDPYAYIAYDVVWAYAYSLLTVNKYDSEAVRTVLPEVTESLFGASGLIVLDKNGDRATGDYGLWRIVYEAEEYEWKLLSTYIYATDSIEWLP